MRRCSPVGGPRVRESKAGARPARAALEQQSWPQAGGSPGWSGRAAQVGVPECRQIGGGGGLCSPGLPLQAPTSGTPSPVGEGHQTGVQRLSSRAGVRGHPHLAAPSLPAPPCCLHALRSRLHPSTEQPGGLWGQCQTQAHCRRPRLRTEDGVPEEQGGSLSLLPPTLPGAKDLLGGAWGQAVLGWPEAVSQRVQATQVRTGLGHKPAGGGGLM